MQFSWYSHWTTDESWFDSQQGHENLLFSNTSKLDLGTHLAHCSVGTGGMEDVSTSLVWPRCEADRSLIPSASVQNKWMIYCQPHNPA